MSLLDQAREAPTVLDLPNQSYRRVSGEALDALVELADADLALAAERCPPGCAKCAASYLDAKERREAALERLRR